MSIITRTIKSEMHRVYEDKGVTVLEYPSKKATLSLIAWPSAYSTVVSRPVCLEASWK